MNLSILFQLANLYVLPFWALMIVLPQWQWTKRILQPLWLFVPLVGVYLYCVSGALDGEAVQALANPDLAAIAQFFGAESAAATGWVHFLVMDLAVGRWIYWQSQTTGIWAKHSLILCLFAGPVGVLSHCLTCAIASRWAPQSLTTAQSEGG